MTNRHLVPLGLSFLAKTFRSLTTKADFGLPQYRRAMSYPTWNHILAAIRTMREYNAGLQGGLTLLEMTYYYRRELPKPEYESNQRVLYLFILDMLDRLDRCDEYLRVWEQIRAGTLLTFNYAKEAKSRKDIQPFIVDDRKDPIAVHFLYLASPRKRIIERKMARSKYRPHAKREELTESELRIRWTELLRVAG